MIWLVHEHGKKISLTNATIFIVFKHTYLRQILNRMRTWFSSCAVYLSLVTLGRWKGKNPSLRGYCGMALMAIFEYLAVVMKNSVLQGMYRLFFTKFKEKVWRIFVRKIVTVNWNLNFSHQWCELEIIFVNKSILYSFLQFL